MALFTKYFHKDDLKKITEACKEAEKTTAGELRVSILRKRDKKDKDLSIKELALKEFYGLKMDETRDKTGILLFLLLNERKFQILADEGINEKVIPETWDDQADLLIDYFKEKKYTDGVVEIIRNMGIILTDYFPIKNDDTNELPDDVIIK